MKGSSRGSQASPGGRTKRYVKNKLQIGDSRPNIMSKPDARSTQMRLTAGTAGAANNLINQTAPGLKEVKMQDGSKFKKEVRARSPQAASVYGTKRKAMKNSYEKPVKNQTVTNTTGSTSTKTPTRRSKAKINRPKNKGLI